MDLSIDFSSGLRTGRRITLRRTPLSILAATLRRIQDTKEKSGPQGVGHGM